MPVLYLGLRSKLRPRLSLTNISTSYLRRSTLLDAEYPYLSPLLNPYSPIPRPSPSIFNHIKNISQFELFSFQVTTSLVLYACFVLLLYTIVRT